MDVLLDHYLSKGTNHEICEDYVEISDPKGFGVLCDGCSSTKWSDFGARLMAHTILSNINFYSDNKENKVFLLKDLVRNLPIKESTLKESLHTTALTFLRSSIHVVGDGVIYFEEEEDGKIFYHEIIIDYPRTNAPWYSVYDLDPNRAKQYEEEFGIKNQKRVKYTMYTHEWVSFEEGEYLFDANKEVQFPIEKNVKRFLMASDGIESFLDYKYTLVSPHLIAQEIFKINHESESMLRRKMNILNKRFEKENIHHYDDLSIIFGSIRSHD